MTRSDCARRVRSYRAAASNFHWKSSRSPVFSGAPLYAPHLIDLEVAQALRRYVLAGSLAPARAEDALQDLRDLSITRYPHDVLLERIWQLRSNVTAYDAAYVALAEAMGATLLTCDRKLASAAKHRTRVEVL